jgi:glycosyltransferase involved in cell wall biosynthesis
MVNIYSLMNWLKKKKIKTVLTHHAEFMYTGGCGVALCPKWKDHCEHCPHKKEVFGRFSIDRSASNWKRFRSSYQSFNLLANVFVSPWLQSQGMQSPLLKGFGQTDIILNPINVEIFNPAADAPLPKALACKKYVLMPVARFFDPNKKTSSIEEVANGIQKEGLFLAIAGAPKDFQFINPNIVNLGFVSSSFEMASLYRHAQCTLVLSQRESFSMPVAESLCCGTPVAGFKAGGPESLPFSKSACFVNQGDYSSLTAAVKKLSNDRAISPLALLSPESISRQYQEVYLDVLNDNKQNEVK